MNSDDLIGIEKLRLRLHKLGACDDARGFVSSCRSPEQAWTSCPNTEWLLWYLRMAAPIGPNEAGFAKLTELVKAENESRKLLGTSCYDCSEALDRGDVTGASCTITRDMIYEAFPTIPAHD